ncbi:Uncharacterised protein [Bordetella pertussis]|nr:Uncharacterised protein [Bordetella pertussis]
MRASGLRLMKARAWCCARVASTLAPYSSTRCAAASDLGSAASAA